MIEMKYEWKGGEPPVTGVDSLVARSTGTNPACTVAGRPQPALGHPCGSVFPEALALQYSLERRRAYLPCSGWVRELPRRCGRPNADLRNRTEGEDHYRSKYVRSSLRLDPFIGPVRMVWH